MKMALKSSDPKENDKILKKKLFHHFGGFQAPRKPPKTLKKVVLGVPDTPQNEEKNVFQNFIIFFGL